MQEDHQVQTKGPEAEAQWTTGLIKGLFQEPKLCSKIILLHPQGSPIISMHILNSLTFL